MAARPSALPRFPVWLCPPLPRQVPSAAELSGSARRRSASMSRSSRLNARSLACSRLRVRAAQVTGLQLTAVRGPRAAIELRGHRCRQHSIHALAAAEAASWDHAREPFCAACSSPGLRTPSGEAKVCKPVFSVRFRCQMRTAAIGRYGELSITALNIMADRRHW